MLTNSFGEFKKDNGSVIKLSKSTDHHARFHGISQIFLEFGTMLSQPKALAASSTAVLRHFPENSENFIINLLCEYLWHITEVKIF